MANFEKGDIIIYNHRGEGGGERSWRPSLGYPHRRGFNGAMRPAIRNQPFERYSDNNYNNSIGRVQTVWPDDENLLAFELEGRTFNEGMGPDADHSIEIFIYSGDPQTGGLRWVKPADIQRVSPGERMDFLINAIGNSSAGVRDLTIGNNVKWQRLGAAARTPAAAASLHPAELPPLPGMTSAAAASPPVAAPSPPLESRGGTVTPLLRRRGSMPSSTDLQPEPEPVPAPPPPVGREEQTGEDKRGVAAKILNVDEIPDPNEVMRNAVAGDTGAAFTNNSVRSMIGNQDNPNLQLFAAANETPEAIEKAQARVAHNRHVRDQTRMKVPASEMRAATTASKYGKAKEKQRNSSASRSGTASRPGRYGGGGRSRKKKTRKKPKRKYKSKRK